MKFSHWLGMDFPEEKTFLFVYVWMCTFCHTEKCFKTFIYPFLFFFQMQSLNPIFLSSPHISSSVFYCLFQYDKFHLVILKQLETVLLKMIIFITCCFTKMYKHHLHSLWDCFNLLCVLGACQVYSQCRLTIAVWKF